MPTIKEIAQGSTLNQAELLVKDASYIPEEKLCFCPMGCAKTAKDILAEVAATNASLAAALIGETPDPAFAEQVKRADTRNELSVLVLESARIVVAAVDKIREDDLDKDATMPWGGVFPLWQAILLPVSHMTYHDGQLNYIQTLLGDSAFHWME
ncbi:MAG: DUF1572 family protein [Armatimonadetes bacterium]|nr:DUF1572 family protein [Armatimonadota bacterium]